MSAWRTAPLPADWHRLRPAILNRDGHACTWCLDDTDGRWRDPSGMVLSPQEHPRTTAHPRRCTEPGTDVDHLDDPTDHQPANLRTLCGWHHRRRTARQARAARGPAPSRYRPGEAHPGLITSAPTDKVGTA